MRIEESRDSWVVGKQLEGERARRGPEGPERSCLRSQSSCWVSVRIVNSVSGLPEVEEGEAKMYKRCQSSRAQLLRPINLHGVRPRGVGVLQRPEVRRRCTKRSWQGGIGIYWRASANPAIRQSHPLHKLGDLAYHQPVAPIALPLLRPAALNTAPMTCVIHSPSSTMAVLESTT